LERAEADGLPIDNPGVFALRNELIRLYDKEARLHPPTSVNLAPISTDHIFVFSCLVMTHLEKVNRI
jgi:hypothetical protein